MCTCVYVCARRWLCGCVGAWVANTKSQWIRLANWKINSVAVSGIDKEKYRELEKLLHAAFLLCVSLSSLRLCVCVLTHTLTSFLLTNDFSFRLRYFSLTRAFCLILRFTAHPYTHSPIHSHTHTHSNRITHWRCCGFSLPVFPSRKAKEIKQKAQRFISLWSKLNELILIRPVGKIFPTLSQMKTHKKGVGWPCGRGRFWALLVVSFILCQRPIQLSSFGHSYVPVSVWAIWIPIRTGVGVKCPCLKTLNKFYLNWVQSGGCDKMFKKSVSEN